MSASADDLAERVDRIMRADLAFFARFPERRHRLRITSEAEIKWNRLKRSRRGRRWYTLIKWLGPERLHARTVENHDDMETDIPEAIAAWAFNRGYGNTLP